MNSKSNLWVPEWEGEVPLGAWFQSLEQDQATLMRSMKALQRLIVSQAAATEPDLRKMIAEDTVRNLAFQQHLIDRISGQLPSLTIEPTRTNVLNQLSNAVELSANVDPRIQMQYQQAEGMGLLPRFPITQDDLLALNIIS